MFSLAEHMYFVRVAIDRATAKGYTVKVFKLTGQGSRVTAKLKLAPSPRPSDRRQPSWHGDTPRLRPDRLVEYVTNELPGLV